MNISMIIALAAMFGAGCAFCTTIHAYYEKKTGLAIIASLFTVLNIVVGIFNILM
jgi:hypothetical protein